MRRGSCDSRAGLRAARATSAVAVVGVGGREVGEHLAAVVALPDERVLVGPVEPVPRELLREEARHACAADKLRQLARSSRTRPGPRTRCSGRRTRARRSAGRAGAAARATRRTGGCRSGSTQRAAGGDELSADDLCADALPQLGVPLLHPRVLLRLRAREPVLGVLVHVADCGAERPQRLAVRLGERPEPRCVDVRVADCGDLVRVRAVPLLVELGEDRRVALVAESRRARRAGRPPERGVGRRMRLERAQHLEVVRELPRVGSKRASSQRVSSDRSRCSPNSPLHASSTSHRRGRRSARSSERRLGVVLVQPGGDPAVEPECRLASRAPEQVDARAPPLVGHSRRTRNQ